MDDSKTEKLIDLLAELTAQEKLKWAETDDEETFLVKLAVNSISLGRRLNEENVAFNYFIEVMDDNDKKITSIVVLNQSSLWTSANSLFYQAKDKALNVDAVIDKILEELQNKKFGF